MRSNEIVGKRLLNVEEAAQYLGLQVDTIYKKSRLREQVTKPHDSRVPVHLSDIIRLALVKVKPAGFHGVNGR